jgi:hypothetical protein
MGVFRADNEDELRKHVENAFAAIAESAILSTNPGVSVCLTRVVRRTSVNLLCDGTELMMPRRARPPAERGPRHG